METRETRWSASEIKFLVQPALGVEIERWAKRWLTPDPHGPEYRISTIYFDTPDRNVFLRKGSFGRAKYRIRRYGDADHVFLERKLRTSNAVTKRRSIVELDDLPLLETGSLNPRWPEGRWFHRRIQARGLQPAWQISYQRTARVLETKVGPIRLTLDKDLRAIPVDSFAFRDASEATPLFPGDERLILELKFAKRMPVLFRELIDELVLTPQPVSKFRLAAGALAYA